MRLNQIPTAHRPRERFEREGASVLNNAELLAILLQKGSVGENVVDLCHRIFNKYSLHALARLSLAELQKVKGVGRVKALQIKALFEFSRRYGYARAKRQITSAKSVFDLMEPKLRTAEEEQYILLLLDAKNRLIKEELIGRGILDAVLIHPREVFRSAIRESARAIILVHNHPSGDPTPSPEDKSITEQLFAASRVLDIPLLDHVIIGGRRYVSMQKLL